MTSFQLRERAMRILELEPNVGNTKEIRESFALPANTRPPLHSVAEEQLNSVHGTNFAVIIQALRNANGQIAPPERLEELGISRRTGESLKSAGSTTMGLPFVAAGLLRAGLGMALRYANIEAGCGNHV